MKSTPAALVAHMSGGSGKLAHLFLLTRTDGYVLAVTDWDSDITYPPGSPSVTYSALLAADASAMQTTAALSVDNLEVKGFLADLGVNESDIASGLWDFCEIRIFRVNPNDLTMGDEKLPRGWFGNLSIGGGAYNNEVRSLAQKLQSNIGESVLENCSADLFDSRCKLVATEGTWKFSTVAVSTIVAAQRQFTAAALTQAADFFTGGKVTWTLGANTGLSKEIKTHAAGGNILLQEPMPYVIAAGDEFTIYAGCTKRFAEDCVAKFNNAVNFRGFPSVPGNDSVLRGPL